jgi:hypothetical protein
VVTVVNELAARHFRDNGSIRNIWDHTEFSSLGDAQQPLYFEDALHGHLDAFGAWVNHEVTIGVEVIFFDFVRGKFARG